MKTTDTIILIVVLSTPLMGFLSRKIPGSKIGDWAERAFMPICKLIGLGIVLLVCQFGPDWARWFIFGLWFWWTLASIQYWSDNVTKDLLEIKLQLLKK